ncbi:hypothetical protein, partial [Bosea thiooxidans]
MAQRDQRGSGIDAGDGMPLFQEVPGDRLAGTAADVEDGGPFRHERQETVEPGAFERRLAAQSVIGGGMALVEIDDGIGRERSWH